MISQAGPAALSLLLALPVEDGRLRPGEQQGLSGLCGDGVIDPGEACDDGNTAPGDGCGADCGLEAGYSCYGQPSPCNAGCGDGALGEGEQCDDGNSTGGDGCGAHCAIEPGHGCTGVPSVCTVACADGIKDTSEACDDGNTGDGDGCSAACAPKAGSSCQHTPVRAFFTRRGLTDCTRISSIAHPQLPAAAAQAALSTPGRYRIQYVSGAISFSPGGNWLPGIIGVNFTREAGPGAFSIVSVGWCCWAWPHSGRALAGIEIFPT